MGFGDVRFEESGCTNDGETVCCDGGSSVEATPVVVAGVVIVEFDCLLGRR